MNVDDFKSCKSFLNIKKKFPIFKTKINGKDLVYLDSAASAQKPELVIDKRVSNRYVMELFSFLIII